jgi:hypothetical protein
MPAKPDDEARVIAARRASGNGADRSDRPVLKEDPLARKTFQRLGDHFSAEKFASFWYTKTKPCSVS